MTRSRKWTAAYTARALAGFGLLLATTLATNCNDQKEPRPVHSQPVEQPAAGPKPSTKPNEQARPSANPSATQSDSQPAQGEQPESRPEPGKPVKPESTYVSEPPYPVALYVADPAEKQPGWLRIEALANDKTLGEAHGKFPEHNRIYVDTGNVRRIRIHVGHLPLRANERVILQIDGQGMVISRSRPFTTLELSSTGVWEIVKDEK